MCKREARTTKNSVTRYVENMNHEKSMKWKNMRKYEKICDIYDIYIARFKFFVYNNYN